MAAKRISKEKQKQILNKLEKLAEQVGLRVSYGDMKFAGLRLKSGQCLFKGERWLVIGSKDRFEDKLDLFREAFQHTNLTDEELSPELAEIIIPKGFPADNPEPEPGME
ncbi:MAG: hypothetical protein JRG97_14765 [Deltaproteobacteria bacterium]|nr:hypothetical protein [Deltaproteobacteria bacterium]MBW2053849.1 hypothetical protein [Deltaproteobacteria bacterium]MBW2142303.1 hypothetical protein [Deltaproteobacteria bacterium]MBW2324308.1 hypothetical protein [Deltaproteobacteria bacterium]